MVQNTNTRQTTPTPTSRSRRRISPLHVVIAVLSVLAIIVGVIGTVLLTLSLFGVTTDKEQYAGAFVLTATLTLATAAAAAGLGKRVAAIVPAVSSAVLAVISVNNFFDYLHSKGHDMYSSGGLLNLYALILFLALPLFILGSLEMWQRRAGWRYTHLASVLAIVFLFGLFFVLPTHMGFDKQRNEDMAEYTSKSSAYKEEVAALDAEQAKLDENDRLLEAAADKVVKAVYDMTQAGQPLPDSYTPPAGYEFAEYTHDKYKLRFCIKPVEGSRFLGVLTDPFTDGDSSTEGRPLVWSADVAASCKYAIKYSPSGSP